MKFTKENIKNKSTAPGTSEKVDFIPGASVFIPKKRTSFWIPYEFLCELETKEDRKAFAVWLKLKSMFRDTKFMNYSVSRCSQMTGISPYLLRKYVPIIIDNGWARMIKKDLVLVSFKKIFPYSRNNVNITVTGSVADIENELLFAHISKDYSQQKFMSDVGLGRLKANYRTLKKVWKRYYQKSMCQHRTYTSYRRIANKCNVSLSKAHALCMAWVASGRMSIKTEFITLAQNVDISYRPHMTDHGLVVRGHNGTLVLITGSSFAVHGDI